MTPLPALGPHLVVWAVALAIAALAVPIVRGVAAYFDRRVQARTDALIERIEQILQVHETSNAKETTRALDPGAQRLNE